MNSDVENLGIDLLPFDNEVQYPSFWGRLWQTIWMFLSHPVLAFGKISNSSSGKDSFPFILAIGWPIHAIVELLKLFALHSNWLRSRWFQDLDPSHVSPLSTALSIAIFPLGSAIGFWIFVFILHGSLWVWRGLANSFGSTQTARATGFTLGMLTITSWVVTIPIKFVAPEMFFPHSGIVIQLILITLLGYGLAKAHRVAIWRGVMAALTPIALFLFVVSGFSPKNMLKLASGDRPNHHMSSDAAASGHAGYPER